MNEIVFGKYRQLGLLALLVLILGMLPPTLGASSLDYQTIVGNVVWDTGLSIDTDVVVTDGAMLTIASGVTVYASNYEHGVAYPNGLNPYKIEIIVESGGTLVVESGAQLIANAAGDWYGVVFLPGSLGNISGATIRNGTVGVTIQGAGPTIQNNTIQDMQGLSPDLPFGSEGGWAAGIVISGASGAQIISNTISNVHGGSGAIGYSGADGQAGGQAGENGGKGGNGGKAYGIWVHGGATPTVQGNTISNITGGSGTAGGSGGDGAAGDASNTRGGDGGSGGSGGNGGRAYGIVVENTGANCLVQNNQIGYLVGGYAGMGSTGGDGRWGYGGDVSTVHGGDGGTGGNGGHGGMGGYAFGIYVQQASPVVEGNTFYGNIQGSPGEGGGSASFGGAGGSGVSLSNGIGEDGGNGGSGGSGGQGGSGGPGGVAAGIVISGTGSPVIRHNISAGTLTAGNGSTGGSGGNGGYGGPGGSGDNPAGSGGHGGHGGYGGSGGYGGDGGVAVGLLTQAGATPTIARNRFSRGSGGSGGSGGNGGNGGHGSYGGDGAVGGNGGDGGFAGAAGTGGGGGNGGPALGAAVTTQLRFENNLLHSFIGGNPATGGNGGTGGDGGCGGSGDTAGTDQDGSVGGDGGDGGSAGSAAGMTISSDNAEVINNTICNANANANFGLGGGAGAGGLSCSGSASAPGAVGAEGFGGEGIGVHIASAQPTLFNNIVVLHAVGQHTPGGGVPLRYGIWSNNPTAFSNLDYNNVYGWDYNYHNVVSGTHDLEQDPLFVNDSLYDYHLQQGSPSRNSGAADFGGLNAPGNDLDGQTRPQGAGYDMGAYEYVEGSACVPVTGVTISGPSSGVVGGSYGFSANTTPANASGPIEYLWSPTPGSGQYSANVSYSWSSPGTYTIDVAAGNCSGAGQASNDHTITISAGGTMYTVYLPVVMKDAQP